MPAVTSQASISFPSDGGATSMSQANACTSCMARWTASAAASTSGANSPPKLSARQTCLRPGPVRADRGRDPETRTVNAPGHNEEDLATLGFFRSGLVQRHGIVDEGAWPSPALRNLVGAAAAITRFDVIKDLPPTLYAVCSRQALASLAFFPFV
mmetsp:Transcript_30431/g.53946  ORF Transcript_30431/g.53946 Transcript_30431/m.53946 type:complete len:155 (+) Transcript_30431:62-526(+)